LLSACSAGTGLREPELTQSDLLSFDTFRITAVREAVPISPVEVWALDDEMRAFVAAQVGDADAPRLKLQRLLEGMQRSGLFELDYAIADTTTARTTFHERRGNCLSFTILFVALAREAGIDVRYRLVDMPPVWSTETDFVVLRQHVNTVARTAFHEDFVIDFNAIEVGGRYDTREIDDREVLALFYNNLGAEALIRGDHDTSFAYFRAAVLAAPAMTGSWTNLGALYSRNGRYPEAEAAYLHALSLEPNERSALSNLAGLYGAMGNRELAAQYRERVRNYQLRNPYFHFAQAQRAVAGQDYPAALSSLRTSLRLKRDEPRFYLLQGQVLLALGRGDEAAASFERGRDYAPSGPQRSEYDQRIQSLAYASDAAPP
jgi:Flp pilus assembly protein TadD